jgi:hypothetical protein
LIINTTGAQRLGQRSCAEVACAIEKWQIILWQAGVAPFQEGS